MCCCSGGGVGFFCVLIVLNDLKVLKVLNGIRYLGWLRVQTDSRTVAISVAAIRCLIVRALPVLWENGVVLACRRFFHATSADIVNVCARSIFSAGDLENLNDLKVLNKRRPT